MFPGFDFVMMLACAAFFYRAGEEEYSRGIVLASVSLALWLGTSYLLGLGWLGGILIQAGLFAGLTVLNLVRAQLKK